MPLPPPPRPAHFEAVAVLLRRRAWQIEPSPLGLGTVLFEVYEMLRPAAPYPAASISSISFFSSSFTSVLSDVPRALARAAR